MNCTHRHVRCNEDIYNELFYLLSSMRKHYAEKVVNGNMNPERFIKMFCDSHHFIDCTRPCCRNAHRMNMGIVLNLYTKEKKLFDEYLCKNPFARKDFSELLHRYLTARTEHEPGTVPKIVIGGKFTEKQVACLAEIAHTYRLFLLPENMDDKTAVTALLQCKRAFAVKVINIRNLAVFFDELLAQNLIAHDWQSIMDKGGFLLSPRSDRRITSSTLSSALNRTKASPTVTQVSIRKAIKEMQKWNITDR